MTRPPIICALAALIMPACAVAQTSEIIVTALPRAKGDAAYDIVTIDRDRLTSTASGRIEDALKDVAGLTQFRRSDSRSANATSQGATLRGLGGNASSRALLVLDGVPQSDPFGGWITWPAYAPERLGTIRVTRGGGSGEYGAGALAGTIEFESVDARTLSGVTTNAAYGSRNSVEASTLIGGALGSGSAFIAANYARSDGFVPIVAAQRGPADIAAPYEQATLSARAVVPVSNGTELQASALAFTDRRTRGTILSSNGGDGADASLRLIHRGAWAWSALAYVQLRKFESRFVALDAARATVTQTVDQFNVPSTGVGARFEVRPPTGTALEVRLGGDWRRTTGQTNELFTFVGGLPTRRREGGGESETLGAFAEASATIARLTLTGGARIDHWAIRNGRLIETTLASGAFIRNERPADRQGWEPTGRAGFAYDAGPVLLRGAAYIGWRLPTLNELYRPFRVGADATAANAALNPERMKGVEIGLEAKPVRGLRLSATAFTNRLESAIANVTIGRGPGTFAGVGFVASGGTFRQRLNIDAITSNGVEFDAHYRANDWRFDASYALTDARVRGSGAAVALNGLRPAQVAQHNASATLGWQGLSATVRYVSAQFEDDQNSRTLRGAVSLDATASVPVTNRLTVIIRGENVTDTRIDAAISATGIVERATPRTLWIGLRWGVRS
ncbi:MAG: TonB-dependent receptor [Sphingomonadaceae bacterium]